MDNAQEIILPEGVGGVATSRSWQDEAALLHISSNEFWEGKRILSLGSGKKSDDPDKVFEGGIVTAYDPLFFTGLEATYSSFPNIVKKNLAIKPSENTAHRLVKGVGQQLPFADGSFDLVTSCFAVPMDVPEEEKVTALGEAVRVCKPGGEVRLYPVNVETNKGVAAFLEMGEGFSVRFEGALDQRLVIITKDKK